MPPRMWGMTASYFRRTSPTTYLATGHTSGAWAVDEQHIAPALGLLAHLLEEDFRARHPHPMFLARLSFDIYGTMPIAEISFEVEVLRPGRTIELVEARLLCGQRQIVSARGWFLSERDTTALAGTSLAPIPAPGEHRRWDPSALWAGGALETIEVRRDLAEPGRGTVWVDTDLPLVDDAEASALARAVGLLDFANGMSTRADPAEVAFPNLDLTVHFFRRPARGPVGLDTTVSFGPSGVGLTHSIVHDAHGPVGASSQLLTVRPSPA